MLKMHGPGLPRGTWGYQDPALHQPRCTQGPWELAGPAPAPLSSVPRPQSLTVHLFSDVSSPQLPLWASEQSEAFLVSRPPVTLTV